MSLKEIILEECRTPEAERTSPALIATNEQE
jgi:hypothetical protein